MLSCQLGSPTVPPGQQRQQALHLLRAMLGNAIVPDEVTYRAAISVCKRVRSRALQRHVIVPDVAAYSAAISACEPGQQHRQSLCLLRATRRYAIVLDVVTCSTALSACERVNSTSRPHISCGRCSAMSSRRMWSFTGLPPARAIEPAALVDLTSSATVAAPRHRARCGHLQCCQQRRRKCQRH